MTSGARARRGGEQGQSLIEFAMVLPLLVLLVLGVVELSYALLDMHVATSFSREGANLISRNTTLQDAVTAMRHMSSRPINLEDGSSKIILSVVRRVGTAGAANFDQNILFQRIEYGTFGAASQLAGGGGAFGPAPDYQALDPDNDGALRISNLPLTLPRGGTLFVAEVFTRHTVLTPLASLGLRVPERLYSVAYF